MSREYPCVYYDNEKCRKDPPEENYVDWCVMGPCSNETPSNGDRVRSMNDAALAEWIVSVIDFTLRQNGIVKSSVVCAAYKQRFLRHLMRPAEEADNGHP